MNHKHIIGRYKNNNDDEENNINEVDVNNFDQSNIFYSPLWSMELDCDNDKILDECLDLEKKYPKGVYKSNFGGWQSEVYDLKTIKRYTTPHIRTLAENILDITFNIFQDFSEDNDISEIHLEEEIGWWININRGHSYNVLHSHPGCSIIGIYYVNVPTVDSGKGELMLIRQDAMSHNSAFANVPNLCEFSIEPKNKHLYLMPSTISHYVTAHSSNEERVSIAFNIG